MKSSKRKKMLRKESSRVWLVRLRAEVSVPEKAIASFQKACIHLHKASKNLLISLVIALVLHHFGNK